MTRKEIQQAPTVAVWSSGLAGLEIKSMEYGMEDSVLCVWTGDNSTHRHKVQSGRKNIRYMTRSKTITGCEMRL